MEVVGLVVGLASAPAAASHARKLSRSLRRVLVDTRLIDKDIYSKSLHFRTFGDAIDSACASLRDMQGQSTQSPVLQKIASDKLLSNLDESCHLMQKRLAFERDRIEKLRKGFSLFGKKTHVLENIKWEFSLKSAVVSLEPEVNGIKTTLGLIVNVATLELLKISMSDPKISQDEYERLQRENQRLTRELQDQEVTVRFLAKQNLMVFTAPVNRTSKESLRGPPVGLSIENLVRLSETVRQKETTPRPTPTPEEPPSPPPQAAMSSENRPRSTTPQPILRTKVLRLGPSGDQENVRLRFDSESDPNGRRPILCTAVIDETIQHNLISLEMATAAGWDLVNLVDGDFTMVQYTLGRQEAILYKTQAEFVNLNMTGTGLMPFFILKTMGTGLRLGRQWAEPARNNPSDTGTIEIWPFGER